MSFRFRKQFMALAMAWSFSLWGASVFAADVTLEEDVAPLVKTLSRPVDVYHWAEGVNAKRAGYTRRRIELFWQSSLPQSGPVGNGLVAATDPLSGRRKGEEWVLFRYTLPKGFRFVDIRASDRSALSARALDRLRARGCTAQSLNKLFAAEAGPACRKIAVDTVKVLQADGVVFPQAVSGFDYCPKRPGAAFLIADGTRFLPEGATLLGAAETAHPERLLTQKSYVESSIFGCGTAEEDRFPDAESAVVFDFEQVQKRFESVSRQLGKALESLHPFKTRVSDLALGELRKDSYFEKAVKRDSAPDAEGVDSIQFFKFRGEDQFGLKWVDLKCQEDLPDTIALPGDNPECRKIQEQITKLADQDPFWAETRADFKAGRFKDRWYWHACWPRAEIQRRQSKYCGMIGYPEPDTIDRRLKAILKRASDYFSSDDRSESALRLALVTERELAALRPFARDNAGISQRIVDSITLRAELPPLRAGPELFMSEERYIQLGLEAAAESVRELRARLRQLEETPGGDK